MSQVALPRMNREGSTAPWLVVLDQAVRDWRRLLTAAPASAQVLVLDSRGDGLRQISDHLRRFRHIGYQGIAVVAEASAGSLVLGGTAFDGGALERQAEALGHWRRWLAAGGGLRLYGCRLAAGSAGRQWVQRLAALTGLGVAASARPVGPASLGGTTILECVTGTLTAAPRWLENALSSQLGHVLGGDEVDLAVLHAEDPVFQQPISGQLQLAPGEVLENDSAAPTAPSDGSWTVVSEFGTLSVWPDGRWQYQADPSVDWSGRGVENDLIGSDYFLFRTSSGSAVALRVDVFAGVNDAPVPTSTEGDASGEVIEAGSGSPGQPTATGQLSATDVDGYAPLRWALNSGENSATTAYGSFSIDPETGVWIYTLNNEAAATNALATNSGIVDSVEVVVVDAFGASDSQTLRVAIIGRDDPPTLNLDSVSSFTEDDTANAVGSIVATFSTSDPEASTVSVALSDTTHYALGIGPNTGKILLTAAGLALVNSGTDLPAFTLTPNDGTTNGPTVSVDPSVTPVNDAPALTGNQAALPDGTEDTTYTLSAADLLAGFSDLDGDSLAITNLAASNGFVADNGDGTYTITPDPNFNGTLTLNYSVSDGSSSTTAANTVLFTNVITPFSGTVIDGYLMGATVFADADIDRVQDPNEPWTLTDSQGRFLFPDSDLLSGVLVASGGTDSSTGQLFRGVLMAPIGTEVITPLTTLVVTLSAAGRQADAEQLVATALGLTLPNGVAISSFDPFAVLNDRLASETDKTQALEIQKAAAQVATVLNAAAAFNLDLSAVLTNLAQTVIGAQGGVSLDLGSAALLSTLLDDGDGSTAAVPASAITQLSAANTAISTADTLIGVEEGQIASYQALPAPSGSGGGGGSGGTGGSSLPPTPTPLPTPTPPAAEPSTTQPNDLVVSNQSLAGKMPMPTIVGAGRSSRLVGTSGRDVIRGVPLDDTRLGRRRRDCLTGKEGDDLFQLGDERSSFYNDGKRRSNGSKDYARITDFNRGDRIQLHGSATNYLVRKEKIWKHELQGRGADALLRQGKDRKLRVTALYINDGRGKGSRADAWDRRDELIGYVQVAQGPQLNLLDLSQFIYVTPPSIF